MPPEIRECKLDLLIKKGIAETNRAEHNKDRYAELHHLDAAIQNAFKLMHNRRHRNI